MIFSKRQFLVFLGFLVGSFSAWGVDKKTDNVPVDLKNCCFCYCVKVPDDYPGVVSFFKDIIKIPFFWKDKKICNCKKGQVGPTAIVQGIFNLFQKQGESVEKQFTEKCKALYSEITALNSKKNALQEKIDQQSARYSISPAVFWCGVASLAVTGIVVGVYYLYKHYYKKRWVRYPEESLYEEYAFDSEPIIKLKYGLEMAVETQKGLEKRLRCYLKKNQDHVNKLLFKFMNNPKGLSGDEKQELQKFVKEPEDLKSFAHGHEKMCKMQNKLKDLLKK